MLQDCPCATMNVIKQIMTSFDWMYHVRKGKTLHALLAKVR